jgi:hypothetical protein
MTEQEWLACTDPDLKLHCLPTGHDQRKLVLYACACARRAWRLVTSKRPLTALTKLEDMTGPVDSIKAERTASRALVAVGLALARTGALGRAPGYNTHPSFLTAVYDVVVTARVARVATLTQTGRKPKALRIKERRAQRELLHDILGNPFRDVTFDPAWRTPDVCDLARAAHDNRYLPEGGLDRYRLIVLADALEEAGCADRAILDHCRGPGRHVRGCHVLDAILSRA